MRKLTSLTNVLKFAVAATFCAGTLACSKEEQKTQTSGNGAAASSAPAVAGVAGKSATGVDLAKSLLEVVPKDALGFFLIEGKHPAYIKYKNSPWAGSNTWSGMLKGANGEAQAVADMMKRLGFNLEDKDTFDKMLTEFVFFAAPPAAGDTKPAVGVVFRPDSTFKLSDFVANVKKEVGAAGGTLKAEDATLAGGPGVRFEDTSDGGVQANPMKEFFLAQKGGLGVVATSKTVAENILSATGTGLPDILQGANFQKASLGLPSNQTRFGTGFFDMEKFAALADKFGNPELSAKLKAQPIPVKAISMALAMDDAPRTDVRLLYDESSPLNKEWIATLGSSPSGSLLAALPSKPLFFISIDGQTIQKAKEKFLVGLGDQAAMYRPQLAALDGITRIGIAAKSAAPGQSMLPIPELLIVAETKEASKLAQAIESILGPMVASGMPGMAWKSTTENGVAIRSMQSPMGMGAFLASSKNLMILSSTDGQMKGALSNISGQGAGFAKGLPSTVEQVLAKDATVGNLYVNFGEVASALESVGGMIAMFAPQGQDAQQFLSPENLQALRKMGTVVGSITLDAGAINIHSFYQGS